MKFPLFCAPALALLVAFAASACRSDTPASCEALIECCEEIGDGTVAAQCRDAVASAEGDDRADSVCRQAMDAYRMAGVCGGGSGTPDSGMPSAPMACQDLRVCCNQLGGGSQASCLATVGQLEMGSAPETDCRNALSGFTMNGQCQVAGAPGPEDNTVACGDNVDNDMNGFTDCDDNACKDSPDNPCAGMVENSDATCSDNIDNDGNGFTDCEDFACTRDPNIMVCRMPEDSDATCMDNIDNDGNGFTDCEDFGCSRNPDVTVCMTGDPEDTDALCSDMMDNDGDGFVDCEDFDCSRSDMITVCEGDPEDNQAACSDMMDNDLDGFVDCEDFDCGGVPPCP